MISVKSSSRFEMKLFLICSFCVSTGVSSDTEIQHGAVARHRELSGQIVR